MSTSQRNQPRSAWGGACKECQRRKSRCSGIVPCSFCSKTGKDCVFEDRPQRTRLTRQNLDKAEQRCHALETLLGTLSPDLDVEKLLKKQRRRRYTSVSPSTSPEVDATQDVGSITPSNEYEWHESPLSPLQDLPQESKVLGDGMASLPSKPDGTGYLGSSSGSSLLETISALLPLASDATAAEGPKLQQSPSGPENSRLSQRTSISMLGGNLAFQAEMGRLIDAYFIFYNISYPILHERTFRDIYKTRASISAKSSWHLVFYMVLAIGHWVLSTKASYSESTYYSAARSRLSTRMLESGTLGSVQAFLLMGNYLQKRDRPNTGYNLIGLAFRMALGLGLHREFPAQATTEDTLAKERRRQVWWVLYCFESGFSITTGRPTTTSDAFVDVKMPRNIEDSNLVLRDTLGLPVQYPTAYSAIIAQAHLAVIANKVHNAGLSAHMSNSEIASDMARDMEAQLLVWKASLPAYFREQTVPQWFYGPRAVVLWKEQNLRMMLWRDGQRCNGVKSYRSDAGRKCQLAAIETIRDISTFCSQHTGLVHLGISWYAIYFLFQAILVLDMILLQFAELLHDDSLSSTRSTSITEARDCLSGLAQKNSAAQRCIAVLDRINNHLTLTTSEQAQANPSMPSGLHTGFISQTTPDSQVMDENYWLSTADPALQGFFGDAVMTNLFDGLEGFPNTQEEQYFGYIPGDIFNVDRAQGPFLWTDSNHASG